MGLTVHPHHETNCRAATCNPNYFSTDRTSCQWSVRLHRSAFCCKMSECIFFWAPYLTRSSKHGSSLPIRSLRARLNSIMRCVNHSVSYHVHTSTHGNAVGSRLAYSYGVGDKNIRYALVFFPLRLLAHHLIRGNRERHLFSC